MISFQNMKEDTTPKPLKTREWLPYHVPVLKIFHSSLQLFRHNLLKELYSSIALGIKEMSEQYIYHISDPKLLNVLLLLLLQSYPTLCDPIDGSPPSSPVPGILQARTLEWVAISFSNAWKWKVKVKLLSRVRLLATPWTAAYQAHLSMRFSRQEYWSGLPLPSPTQCDKLCFFHIFYPCVFSFHE